MENFFVLTGTVITSVNLLYESFVTNCYLEFVCVRIRVCYSSTMMVTGIGLVGNQHITNTLAAIHLFDRLLCTLGLTLLDSS